MNDFIFGTLATDELRLALTRNRLAGVTHIQRRNPRDPLPGEAITLELSVGPGQPGDSAWVYWTSDGSDPLGSLGQAQVGQVTQMELSKTALKARDRKENQRTHQKTQYNQRHR